MQEQAEKRTAIEMIVILVALVVVILILLWNSQSSDSRDTSPVETSTYTSSQLTRTAYPTRTPRPTNTQRPDVFGIELEFEYQSNTISDEINERTYSSAVPSTWLSGSSDARYRVVFDFESGRARSCSEYTSYFDNRSLTLTYRAIDLVVRVYDLQSEETQPILRETFNRTLPDDCPYTFEFETNENGVLLNAVEYVTPGTSNLSTWLRENVRGLQDMPATATPLPTQTPVSSPTPTVTSTPLADMSLIVSGTITLRDENGDILGAVSEGELPLVGIQSERYVVLYNGERAYLPISTDNAQPEQGIRLADTLIFDGLVIVRDADGSEIARESSGEYILLDIVDDYYIIEYGDEQGYVHTSSTSVTLSSQVIVDDASGTPEPAAEVAMTATPFTENALIITGDTIILDLNNVEIATISEGEIPLLGMIDDNYIVLYEGQRAFVAIDLAGAQPEQELVPQEILTLTGAVIIRDENGDRIAMESTGQYGLISVDDDNYVIDYNGQPAYILISSRNVISSTGIISDISPQATAIPVATSAADVIQSDYFGAEIAMAYSSDTIRREVNPTRFSSLIPVELRPIVDVETRYRVELYFDMGGSFVCDGYRSLFDTDTLTLIYRAIDVRVTVYDLAALNEPEILSEEFSTSLPDDCPFSYDFDVVNGEYRDTTEYRQPVTTPLRNWLSENLRPLPDMPPTATPTLSPTPTLTLTPRPTVTPFQSGTIEITGLVIIRNGENFAEIGRESSGVYTVIGIQSGYYVIDYDGVQGYILRNSSNVRRISDDATPTPTLTPDSSPTQYQGDATPTPIVTPGPSPAQYEGETLVILDEVVIRDSETYAEITRVSEGQFPYLGFERGYFIIEYNGEEALIRANGDNAVRSSTLPTATATSAATEVPVSESFPVIDFPVLTINTTVIVYTESGSIIGTAGRGDYLLAEMNTQNYIIIFEGEQGYIPRDIAHIVPGFSQNTVWTIQITGLVILRDENGNEIDRVSEGEFALLLVEGDSYIIDYNGVEVFLRISSTNATLNRTVFDSE